MKPSLRVTMIVTCGVLAAIIMGVGVANEQLFFSTLLVGALVWMMIEWSHGPMPDAWILAWAIFGYIVGNRGFAQFSVSSELPLLPAELALLVAIPLLVIRLARKQVIAIRRDFLNVCLLLWILVGTLRLPLDLKAHGFLALRDFAMVYYAAFFFIAQAISSHFASVRLLRRTLTVSFLVLISVAAVDKMSPDFFLRFTVRGVPLIYHKSDLLAAFLAAGFFWLWTRWENSRSTLWLLPAAASLLMLGTTASPRAAMVAVVLVTVIWLIARRWQIAGVQLVIVGTAVSVAVFIFALGNRNIKDTAAYSTYEHVVSIFDFQGKGTYVTTHESGDPGDNNRFRMVWWRAVADETLKENPVFGLGFGHDLAARFLADFGLIAAEDFSARSPHSMLMSVLGRMGLLGLALWIGLTIGMAMMTCRIFQHGNFDHLGLVSVAWVLWISGCFGIVLEGPMGAVVFWTVLGLANVETVPEEIPEVVRDEQGLPVDLHPEIPPDEVPAAP